MEDEAYVMNYIVTVKWHVIPFRLPLFDTLANEVIVVKVISFVYLDLQLVCYNTDKKVTWTA